MIEVGSETMECNADIFSNVCSDDVILIFQMGNACIMVP